MRGKGDDEDDRNDDGDENNENYIYYNFVSDVEAVAHDVQCRPTWVPEQLVADNSSQDNSSRTTRTRTIRRGQFIVKYKINFIESAASISTTFFSSISLPLQ